MYVTYISSFLLKKSCSKNGLLRSVLPFGLVSNDCTHCLNTPDGKKKNMATFYRLKYLSNVRFYLKKNYTDLLIFKKRMITQIALLKKE